MYVETEAERTEDAGRRGDVRTLYEINRRLSWRFQRTCKLVRNEAGVLLRTATTSDELGRQQTATIYHRRESKLEVRCQRRFFWTSPTGYGVMGRHRRNSIKVC